MSSSLSEPLATSGSLTRFEYVRILATRASQLERGAPTTETHLRSSGFTSWFDVARAEIVHRKLPWLVVRPRVNPQDLKGAASVPLVELSLECIEDIEDRHIFPPEDPTEPMQVEGDEDDAPALSPPQDWAPSNCAECLVEGIRRQLFVHSSLIPNAYSGETLAPLQEHVRSLVDGLAGLVFKKGEETYALRQVCSVAFERDACGVETDGGVVIDVSLRAWCLRLTPGTRADVACGSEDAESILAGLPAHVGALLQRAERELECEAVGTGSIKGMDQIKAIVLAGAEAMASHEPEQTLVVHDAITYRLKEMPSRSGVLCIMKRA